MAARGIECAGVVIGAWPEEPDLAMIENLADLRTLRGRPIDGVLPAGIGDLAPAGFEMVARRSLSPTFGGELEGVRFEERMKGLL
jgi:dethiobiotin synthetase